MNKRRKGRRKAKKDKERKEEDTPVICLFLDYGECKDEEIQHSLYLIKPNLENSLSLSLFTSPNGSVATVVGHLVFIGPDKVIFDLDSFLWYYETHDLCPSTSRFHYGSIYAKDEDRAEGYFYYPDFNTDPIQVVKIGPLPLPLPADPRTMLKSPCFDSEPPLKQNVASESDLGGRIFCYLVTASIDDCSHQTINQHCFRGVWIKFFEEEEVPSKGQREFKFRTLASFCHEIPTEFDSTGNLIKCFVLGSVPQSWSKDPPGNKVHKSNIFRHKASEVLQMDTNVRKEDPTGNDIMMKLLAAQEEIKKLQAELSRKDEVLKAKEAFEKHEAGHLLVGQHKIIIS